MFCFICEPSLMSRSLSLLSELQRHDGGRRLQCTTLRAQCVPHVNYSIHGHILTVDRAQGFQKRPVLPFEGKIRAHINRIVNCKIDPFSLENLPTWEKYTEHFKPNYSVMYIHWSSMISHYIYSFILSELEIIKYTVTIFCHFSVTISGEAGSKRLRSNNRNILHEHAGSLRGYSNSKVGGTNGVQADVGGTRMDDLAFPAESVVECCRGVPARFIGHYINLHGSANHGCYS